MSGHKGVLRVAIEDFLDTFNLGERIHTWFDQATLSTRKELREYLDPLLANVYSNPYLPDEYKQVLRRGVAGGEVVSGTVLVSVIVGIVAGIISGVLSPVSRGMAQWLDRGLETRRAEPEVAFPIQWRFPGLAGEMNDHCQQLGWQNDILAEYEDTMRPRVSTGELAALWKRNFLSSDEFSHELIARGWSVEEIAKVRTLTSRIPGAGDLITMAVREAFHPDLVAKYRYMDNFPPEFGDWLEKQGYDRGWAEKWWVAHWRLPSIRDAFEMLHRGQIGEGELRDLLRAADIAPTWHDPLIAIAYAPYTRVDIRRMYQTGVFKTPDEVYRAYQDIGYNEEKALKLTEFTIREYGEDERKTTKTDILNAYEIGRFTREEAMTMLKSLEYPDWVADVSVSRIDRKRANAEAKEVIRYTKTRYTNWQINEREVTTELSKIPLPGAEINRYIDVWGITRKGKEGRLTKAEAKKMFIDNILDESDYRLELVGRRLSDKYIDLYVEQSKLELRERMEAEVERANKEKDRVEKAVVKTDLDIDLATLNVEIAQARVAIADIKLWITDVTTVEELEEAMQTILLYKKMIADYQHEKAELRRIFAETREGGG